MSSDRPWAHVVTDEASGRVLAVAPPLDTDLLLYGGLSTGVGSSALPLDRGQPGDTHVVRLVRRGRVVHVESLAREMGVGGPVPASGDPDPHARSAVADAFARSVLAVLPVLDPATLPAGIDAPDGAVVVDLSPLATADVFDVAGRLSAGAGSPVGPLPDAVPYAPVGELSTADLAATASGPDGLVLGGRLVLRTGGRPPAALRRILIDPRTVLVEQRVVIRPFPGGAEPLPFHPGSGSYGKRRIDPTRIADDRALEILQPRFRPDREVVFSVDPATPEPFRSAVLEGLSWWSEAFAAAGRPASVRAEVRSEQVDPWGIGVHPLWWVHRAERGWSMGHTVTDPATGEILRGSVRLGSQRIAQLRAMFEALLAPFGDPREDLLLAEIDEALQQRIRQLAAHEAGHALGFVHNYASTAHERPSVMDYPHAALRLDADGPRLDPAYASGPGPWDLRIAALAVGDADRRAALLAADDLAFLTDADGHGRGASSAIAVPWTLALTDEVPDAFAALERIVQVRAAAIARFGPGVAPPDADIGELRNRYGILHLLHRFEVVRVARLIGGAEYGYGLVGDRRSGADLVTPAPADVQRQAVDALTRMLGPEIVEVPRPVRPWLAPASIRHEVGTAVPAGARTGFVADRDGLAAAAVAVVAAELLEPERLNRVVQAGEDDAGLPSVSDVVGAARSRLRGASAREAFVAHAASTLASGRLHAAARRELAAALAPFGDEDAVWAHVLEAASRGDRAAVPDLPSVPAGAPL